MIPIQDLLHRIRWDPAFGKGSFELGYDDHVAGRIVRVPLARVHLEAGERFAFEALEEDGSTHLVPFHRVRGVWRDGELIWQRAPRKPV
jgi:uncharacterized protein (UPF0248 family)